MSDHARHASVADSRSHTDTAATARLVMPVNPTRDSQKRVHSSSSDSDDNNTPVKPVIKRGKIGDMADLQEDQPSDEDTSSTVQLSDLLSQKLQNILDNQEKFVESQAELRRDVNANSDNISRLIDTKITQLRNDVSQQFLGFKTELQDIKQRVSVLELAPIGDQSTEVQNIRQRLVNLEEHAAATFATDESVPPQRLTNVELRQIDIEARMRRSNLLFYNIPEPADESDVQCEDTLVSFMYEKLNLDTRSIALERVHRLGKPPRRGTTGQKPRPVIACFRDYKAKQHVLSCGRRLAGTHYSIQEDFPAEVRSARAELWPDFQRAKAGESYAKIVYPAKLVVGGRLVKDMFPEWGKWGLKAEKPSTATDTVNTQRTVPVRGSSINIPLTDLLHAPPFVPRGPGNQVQQVQPDVSTIPAPPSGPAGRGADSARRHLFPDANAHNLSVPPLALPERPPRPMRTRTLSGAAQHNSQFDCFDDVNVRL